MRDEYRTRSTVQPNANDDTPTILLDLTDYEAACLVGAIMCGVSQLDAAGDSAPLDVVKGLALYLHDRLPAELRPVVAFKPATGGKRQAA